MIFLPILELLDETNPISMIKFIIDASDLILEDQNGHFNISDNKYSNGLELLFILKNLKGVHQQICLVRIIKFKSRYVWTLLPLKLLLIVYMIK